MARCCGSARLALLFLWAFVRAHAAVYGCSALGRCAGGGDAGTGGKLPMRHPRRAPMMSPTRQYAINESTLGTHDPSTLRAQGCSR